MERSKDSGHLIGKAQDARSQRPGARPACCKIAIYNGGSQEIFLPRPEGEDIRCLPAPVRETERQNLDGTI